MLFYGVYLTDGSGRVGGRRRGRIVRGGGGGVRQMVEARFMVFLLAGFVNAREPLERVLPKGMNGSWI